MPEKIGSYCSFYGEQGKDPSSFETPKIIGIRGAGVNGPLRQLKYNENTGQFLLLEVSNDLKSRLEPISVDCFVKQFVFKDLRHACFFILQARKGLVDDILDKKIDEALHEFSYFYISDIDV